MADGRRNNGGHSTKGRAGRKPKADEIKMIEQMDKTLVPQRLWDKLAELVEDGDKHAIRLWLAYRYGKPIETQITHEGIDQPLFPDVHKN